MRIFCITSAGERRYFSPSKPIAVSVQWDANEFLATPHIQGVCIVDGDVVLWTEEFPTIILKNSVFNVDFSKMKIEAEWLIEDMLEDMLEEDDCE